MKKIAVTGASGHIGNVVCDLLLEQGHQVRAFYNTDTRGLQRHKVEMVKGNVLNKSDLRHLIDGCEVVIHCAAIISIHGDPDGDVFRTNTEGPANVLEVSKITGVKKIIHISSVHAVEEVPLTEIYHEKRPYKTAEAEVYDYSKACGEQIMLNATGEGCPEVVVLRPSSVVGPFDFKPSEMGKALLDFYHQKIPALPQGGYDFVDVRDVARSVVAAIEKGISGEVYLLSGKYYSLKELTEVVRKVTGKKVPGIVVPYKLLKLALPFISLYSKISGAAPLFTIAAIDALKNGHPGMDSTKARSQLGHRNRDLTESLRDFYTWHEEHNRLN